MVRTCPGAGGTVSIWWRDAVRKTKEIYAEDVKSVGEGAEDGRDGGGGFAVAIPEGHTEEDGAHMVLPRWPLLKPQRDRW